MHQEKGEVLPVYSRRELSNLKKEISGDRDVVRITGDSLEQLLFIADRICQALGERAGRGRSSLESIIQEMGFAYADIRPQGTFGISLSRQWTNRKNPDEPREYEYTLIADNRNARGIPEYTNQLQEAVNKALDPDGCSFN